MKVMCINDNPLPGKVLFPFKIKFGEIYEVIDEAKINGHLYYEISYDMGYWYLAIHFALLSDIDETELVKEREETFA